MSRRLSMIEAIQTGPHLGRLWSNLSAAEKSELLDIIRLYDHLESGPFESAINRHYISKLKPKRWTTIVEILASIK